MPKTLASDYFEFDKERKEFGKKATLEQMTPEEFQKGLIKINERYEDRVFPQDTFLFDNYEKFERFGMGQGLDFYMCMYKSIEHERDHAIIAKKLGYTPTYGYSFMLDENLSILCKTFTRYDKMPMPLEHVIAITNEPSKLSKNDRDILKFAAELEKK